MNVKRTTVSLQPEVHEIALKRARKFRLSFSAYIAHLIDNDANANSQEMTIRAKKTARQ